MVLLRIAAVLLFAAAASAGERDLVFDAPGGPVRVRLSIAVDGRPVEDRRRAYLDGVLAGLPTEAGGVTPETWKRAFEAAGLTPPVGDRPVPTRDALRAALDERLGPIVEVAVRPQPLVDRLELFAAIDADGDGSLTAAELAAADRLFGRYDADGDGTLTPAELAPAELLAPMPIASGAEFPSDRLPFRWEDAAGKPETAVEVRLIARAFGRPKVQAAASSSGRVAVTAEPRRATLAAGDLTLELDALPGRITADDVKRFYLLRQRQLDADKNGYLDMTEYAGLNLPNLAFAVADENGDGMLFPAELAARLDGLIARETSRVRVEATYEREPLFAKLDADGDGRLSRRELRGAADVMASVDTDGDGRIGLAEFGGRYKLAFSVPNPLDTAAVVSPDMAMAAASGRTVPRTGPDWFQAMDRNGDGDVSRREFLGDAARFTALDADGDGLLNAAEAGSAGTMAARESR